MYGSEEMLAPYKVVWKRMGNKIEAAVTNIRGEKRLPAKPIVPQETIIFVPFNAQEEAHYVCAVLNSRTLELVVKHYSTVGGKAFASAHVLQHVRIPKFNRKDTIHYKLSQLSEKAHSLQTDGHEKELAVIEKQIDEQTAELWGITSKELRDQRANEMAALLRGKSPEEIEKILKAIKKD